MRFTRVRRTRLGLLVVLGVTATLLAAGTAGATQGRHLYQHSKAQSPRFTATPAVNPISPALMRRAGGDRPNIVFVLTDDLSSDLIRYMPNVRALERRGMKFTNYTVSNSLCCPSRASIFTGELPHNTGVRTNTAPNGGYQGFQAHGDARKTFAVMVHRAGYRTAFFGKYFNGYAPRVNPQNPPGWDRWGGVDGGGYRGYRYGMSLDGKVHHYGTKPRDYMTTVLDTLGQKFITSSVLNRRKFLLEVSTFAPHFPAIPAPRDVNSFPKLEAPHGVTWNTVPQNAPPWLATRPGLTQDQIERCNKSFRSRVQAVQAVDRMVGHLEQTLARWGQLRNTVFVFSSDNGFHIGNYALTPGKLLAFDTDVNVPLIAAGPGIEPGSVSRDLVQNIDLAPTFARLAGAHFANGSVDGHSFEPVLHGQDVAWRSLAVVEHTWPGHKDSDPDEQGIPAGSPPSYTALRGRHFTYVRYQHYAAADTQEYYDRADDPHELNNIYGSLSGLEKLELNSAVANLTSCAGYKSCWRAGEPQRQ
jgi:N-acetylglucosamine-6-sulfatase